MATLYHYLSAEKLEKAQTTGSLSPTAPFNPAISSEEWDHYASQFPFPVARLNTFCFLERDPRGWQEYDLFDLLLEEYSTGDHLLELSASDSPLTPLLVRDHQYHSPRAYGCFPEVWRNKGSRDSRPDLREKWYQSTVLLSQYQDGYRCPEVLIPFPVSMAQIKIIR